MWLKPGIRDAIFPLAEANGNHKAEANGNHKAQTNGCGIS